MGNALDFHENPVYFCQMSTAERDALTDVPDGTVIYNTDNIRLEMFYQQTWGTVLGNAWDVLMEAETTGELYFTDKEIDSVAYPYAGRYKIYHYNTGSLLSSLSIAAMNVTTGAWEDYLRIYQAGEVVAFDKEIAAGAGIAIATGQHLHTNDILEKASDHGVEIDGVLIKDGLVDGIDVSTIGAASHAALTIGADAMHSLAGQVLSGAAAAAAQTGHIRIAGELTGTNLLPTITATHSGSAHHAAVTLTVAADTLLGLTTQEIKLDTQTANRVFAGPVSGAAATPTFRAMVALDLAATAPVTSVIGIDKDDVYGWTTTPQLVGIADHSGVTRLTLDHAQPHVTLTGDVTITGGIAFGDSGGWAAYRAATEAYTIHPSLASTYQWGKSSSYIFTADDNAGALLSIGEDTTVYGRAAAPGTSQYLWGRRQTLSHESALPSTGGDNYISAVQSTAAGTGDFAAASPVTHFRANAPAWNAASAAPSYLAGLRVLDQTHAQDVAGQFRIGLDVDAQTTSDTGIVIGIRNASRYVATPSATKTLAAGTAITVNAQTVCITSTADRTLTATPTVLDAQDGALVTIVNVGAYTITFSDQGTLAGSNLRLSATTIGLGPRDSMTLLFNVAINDWVQIGLTNVI